LLLEHFPGRLARNQEISRGFSRMNADTKKNRTLKASPRRNKNPPRFFADYEETENSKNQETQWGLEKSTTQPFSPNDLSAFHPRNPRLIWFLVLVSSGGSI